jgi:transposase
MALSTAGRLVLIKTLLNRCHHFSGFVYGDAQLTEDTLFVELRPRKGGRPECSGCKSKGSIYDTARNAREFEFIPIWGFTVVLLYLMRRVDCEKCGVKVESVPWAEGKNRTCNAYRLFLAKWAKSLSWTEVGRTFRTNWGVVHRAVEWVVAYGLSQRCLDGVTAIGVDEIFTGQKEKYLTVVYQIDKGSRRLLWVARERTKKSFSSFFDMLGEERSRGIQFVASDMWKPYLSVTKARAVNALNVLDRFHICKKLGEAVDKVRATEARKLAREGYEPVLKHARWCFLKREKNLTRKQKLKLNDVLKYDLRSVRAYLLRQSFEHFWTYKSAWWANWFLDQWCAQAMRSQLEPMKKVVKMLRAHRELLMNWFHAKGEISSGAVEGLNTNAKLAIRKARGFRTYEVMETALYHQMGRLPEPQLTHRLW